MRKVLDKINRFLSAATLFVMLIFVIWQVFTRYILKNPSTWSEELVSFLFAWTTLFGASLIVSERDHMNIPAFVETKSPVFQKNMAIFSEIMIFLFSLFVLTYGGIRITKLALNQMTSSLGVAIGIFYIPLPFTGIINMIYSLMNIVDIAKGRMVFIQAESAAASSERIANQASVAKFKNENDIDKLKENKSKTKKSDYKIPQNDDKLVFESNSNKGE